MVLKKDGLDLCPPFGPTRPPKHHHHHHHQLLFANGSDSFGRAVVKEIKLCPAAPNVGLYHREVPPLAGTRFQPSQMRLILFWVITRIGENPVGA